MIVGFYHNRRERILLFLSLDPKFSSKIIPGTFLTGEPGVILWHGSPRPLSSFGKLSMKKIYTRQLLLVCGASLLFQIYAVKTPGQQQPQDIAPPEQQEQDEDVIRISTDLVQTGVAVFDRQGRFVEGLKKEDFELKVDGKPVEVGFFARVTAGAIVEEARLAAASGNSGAKVLGAAKETIVVTAPDRGRVVVFFVDDVHMAPDSMKRAKETISRFIDREMGQNDLVAIASASGQIGFLQQYTDNKAVLKMAVARLSYKSFATRDIEPPVMTDGQAVLIEQGNKDVQDYFVQETVKMLNVPRPKAEDIVKRRARVLRLQSSSLSKATLSSLETLARRS